VDPDFVVFGALASEIDHLPFGSIRTRWSAEALARADVDIEKLTQLAQADVLAACRHIVERFETTESMVPQHGAV
jgi:hypothetical protein